VGGAGGGDIDNIDDGINTGSTGMTDSDLKKEKEELYTMKKQKKKKKWRKLNIGFGYLSLRLLFIVAILETFYLVSYLVSKTFMSEVTDLTSELRLLISREPLYMLVLLSQKELFYSNLTAQILNRNVKEVLAQYHKELIDDEQTLLELFSSNFKYHTTSYNTQFKGLMYSSICDNLDKLNEFAKRKAESDGLDPVIITKDQCETFD